MSNSISFHTKHFVVIGLSLLVFVGLLFVDKTSLKSSKSNTVQNASDNRNSNSILGSIEENIQKEFEQLESKLKNEELPSKKSEILDQLVSLAINKNHLDYAIHYQKQIVEIDNHPTNLSKLGDLALLGLETLKLDSLQYFSIHNIAFESFQKLLEKDPNNNNWKIKLAISKVKSKNSNQIMEGIRDLVEITKIDENHFEANYYLGYFSLESNQPEKALKRFEKCLKIQPQNSNVLMGLGEAYKMLNQRNEAIKHYQLALKYAQNAVQKSKIQSQLELFNH